MPLKCLLVSSVSLSLALTGCYSSGNPFTTRRPEVDIAVVQDSVTEAIAFELGVLLVLLTVFSVWGLILLHSIRNELQKANHLRDEEAEHTMLLQLLRGSELLQEERPQSSGVIRFRVVNGQYGASIYMQPSGRLVHVRARALERGRYPNNDDLFEYIRQNNDGLLRGRDNASHAYKVLAEDVPGMLAVIGREP